MTDAAPVVAVDGPGGVGKGTLCRQLADHLNWHLLDSGSLYRLTAYAAEQAGIDLHNSDAVSKVARNLAVSFRANSEGVDVLLAGADVSAAVRTEQAGHAASIVAANSAVRDVLIGRQRAFAEQPGLIADGRDMGSVVFPDARLKIFLTAGVEERALRRYKQLKDKGMNVSLPALSRDMEARDRRDSERSVAPLRACDDALVLDSTDMSIAAVFATALGWVAEVYPEAF